jgi:NAD(P)-dependent dehydrogenase (short-subunit alcohol dehydrogenase family)
MSDDSTVGRSALVTGGARGIGLASATRLARDGYGVVLFDRDGDVAAAAARKLTEEGLKARPFSGDVVSRESIGEALDFAIAEFGDLKAVVSNAGMAEVVPLLEIDDETWSRVMDVNVTGAFFCIQEAARRMVSTGGGAAVLISSTNAFEPEQNLAAYSVAKAAVYNFVKSAALDLTHLGVRVNGIAPGFVLTRRATWLTEDPELGPAYLETIPARRFAEPADIGDVVGFLVSEDARYMFGQTLVVDGGHSIGVPLPEMKIERPLDPATPAEDA